MRSSLGSFVFACQHHSAVLGHQVRQHFRPPTRRCAADWGQVIRSCPARPTARAAHRACVLARSCSFIRGGERACMRTGQHAACTAALAPPPTFSPPSFCASPSPGHSAPQGPISDPAPGAMARGVSRADDAAGAALLCLAQKACVGGARHLSRARARKMRRQRRQRSLQCVTGARALTRAFSRCVPGVCDQVTAAIASRVARAPGGPGPLGGVACSALRVCERAPLGRWTSMR